MTTQTFEQRIYEIRECTEINDVFEALRLGLDMLNGTEELLSVLEDLQSEHERRGYLDPVTASRRHEVYEEMKLKAKIQLGERYQEFYMSF